MRKLALSAIIDNASKYTSDEDKVNYLQQQNSDSLRTILQLAFDSRVKWLLPEGTPPYKPCPYLDQDGALYSELRKFYIFVDNPRAPEMTKAKREAIYISMIESLHPDDAILVNMVKDHKLPVTTITKDIVNTAFPGLINDE